MLKTFKLAITISFFSIFLIACAPEVGSQQWCDDLKAKPKGEWSGNELADFGKHCIFK